MKKYYILFLLLLFAGSLSAQTNFYSNDFEGYTVGGKIALQSGAPWSTWSNAPGGTEDAVISNTQSHSATKSIYVVNNNNLIFNLYDKTSGRYKIGWYMFVETGKLGYFNVLSDFAGNNSKWAFRVMIYNDSIFVDADGTAKAKLPFTLDTWTHMQLIVDLNDDFATFYLDSTEVVSYKWSKGADGTGSTLKLDAIDFFGWDGTGSSVTGASGYYIDDISVDSVVAPGSSSNLTAVLNGADIDVSWTASTPTPDLYKLSCNGSVVYATTGLSYTDPGAWPNTYIYAVRANYNGQGYSHSLNTDTVTIPGGVTRNLVLMEAGTGTWCQNCPGAAMGLRDLIEVNNKDAVAIEYHSSDNYEIPASAARIGYYNMPGLPTVIADGVLRDQGGNATQSLYSTYLPMYNQCIAEPSFHIINMTIVETSANNYTATITVEQTFAAFSSELKLFAALTESNIPVSWENQTELDYVCRGMFPDENGTALDFSSQTTQTVSLNFSTTGFVKNNCEFVVFVQHHSTRKVTQVAKIDMSSIVGIEELQGKKIRTYPNPASNYVMVLSSDKGNLEIFDISGKLMYSTAIFNPTQVVDISLLNKGVYILRVSNSDKNFTEKLVVE
jgi:hypothetical protein